jgi:hypothetical protein
MLNLAHVSFSEKPLEEARVMMGTEIGMKQLAVTLDSNEVKESKR